MATCEPHRCVLPRLADRHHLLPLLSERSVDGIVGIVDSFGALGRELTALNVSERAASVRRPVKEARAEPSAAFANAVHCL